MLGLRWMSRIIWEALCLIRPRPCTKKPVNTGVKCLDAFDCKEKEQFGAKERAWLLARLDPKRRILKTVGLTHNRILAKQVRVKKRYNSQILVPIKSQTLPIKEG